MSPPIDGRLRVGTSVGASRRVGGRVSSMVGRVVALEMSESCR
jgi:hypothetical protein